jgi:REP element-mobilizing transposase RayT
MVVSEEKAAYHVMSRTALDGLPFGAVEKDEFVRIIKRVSKIYFSDVLGFAVMDNHFHILVMMHPGEDYSDEDIKARFAALYGEDAHFPVGRISYFRAKWSSLSEFVREIKQTFSRYYNRRKKRRGTLWGERFKSVIVERGETLVNCLAYIDLNAVRAGIVEKPDHYRWCSLGCHAQTGNKDGFLSTDFGFQDMEGVDEKERFRRYRRFVYEAGAISKSGGKNRKTIKSGIVSKERAKDFKETRIDRFRNRTRYFTDSGIIGTKSFVSEYYQRFKHMFQSVHEKKPKPVKGLDGVYSLKRLSG